MDRIPLVAVLGPTAVGKTSVGIMLAKRFSGEIVSCDSMQIYKGIPVGTAQPTREETEEIPYHLVSFLDMDREFSVSDYVKLAGEKVREIYINGKLPILVGGTGLYARSLIRGFGFEEYARDEDLRRTLFARAESEGGEKLYQELLEKDPPAAEKIHPNNLKRVVRALEYIKLTGERFSAQEERSRLADSPYRTLILCLAYEDREKLYEIIETRVDTMMEKGLLKEAREVYDFVKSSGFAGATVAQAIGYKEFFPYFEGKISLEEAVDTVKRESRRFAKRQMTWFSREAGAKFIYVDALGGIGGAFEVCARAVEAFLGE